MKRRGTVFAFGLLVTLALLCACGREPSETGENQSDTSMDTTAAGTAKTTIADENGTNYIIVLPAGATSALSEAATSLKGKVFEITGKQLWIKYDQNQSEQEYEILVGDTNRSLSSGSKEMGTNEYEIKFSGSKLLVLAGSQNAAAAGIKYIADNYLSGADVKAFALPADIDIKGETEMISLSTLKSGWNPCLYPASNGVELLYQLWMPKNYDPNTKYPVILYMHSAGVRNDDNSHINTAEAKFLRNFEVSNYADKCIIVAPACPKTAKWVDATAWDTTTYSVDKIPASSHMVAVTELFGDVRATLSCDETRLYTYGMSMGGFAVWDLLARNPGMFAAAIPVAGCGDPSKVSNFAGTAIWVFHGDADASVPYQSAVNMVNALKAIGRTDVKFTTFSGAGHGIWTLTANTAGLLDWLFAQHR